MGFKVFVYGREFFHHKFEVLDGVVVIVSFILDLVLLFREHEFEAVGLLILLRLWRVARIINGRRAAAAVARGLGLSELPGLAFPFPSQSERAGPCSPSELPVFPGRISLLERGLSGAVTSLEQQQPAACVGAMPR